MSRKHTSRGISRFVLVWALIIVCLALIWTVVLAFLTAALEEYEEVQPKYAAEIIFEKYFKEAATETLLEYSGLKVTDLENENAEADYFRSVISGGELSYKKVFSTDSEVTLYAVSAGDVTFASFTVVDGSQTTEMLGLSYPALGKITVSLKPLYGAVIYAPAVAEVYVNGKLLDESYIEGSPVELENAAYFPDDDPDFRQMVNYSVTGLFAEPTVSVIYPGENGQELALENENGVYSAQRSYQTMLAETYNQGILKQQELKKAAEDYRAYVAEQERLEKERLEQEAEEERQRISDSIKVLYEKDFVLPMAEQYNRFIYYVTTDKVRNNTKIYFKPGTTIYNYVSGNYYNWATYYVDAISFLDEETSYYEWLDEAHTKFKCRISLTCSMNGHNMETGVHYDNSETFAMTAYIDISGTSPLVYNLVSTEADLASQQ